MQRFYFTFGQSHYNRKGQPMRDYYVRVMAMGYMEARELFITCFTSIHMTAPDKWAFQYTDAEWNKMRPNTFPKGEYAFLGPVQATGTLVYNMRLHTRYGNGKLDNDYCLVTRQDVLDQIDSVVQQQGWTSHCTFLLNGCIEIRMEHAGLGAQMTGFFNPNKVSRLIVKDRTAKQPADAFTN